MAKLLESIKPIDNFSVIIAAGGSSARFGRNKLLEEIAGIPVLVRTVAAFVEFCHTGNMILAGSDNNIRLFRDILKVHFPNRAFRIIAGGETRQQSVINALDACHYRTELVAVQDAARPFSTPKLLTKCIEECILCGGGAIPGKRITDTLKETDENGMIIGTPDRHKTWTVETPQVFYIKSLKEAYAKAQEAGRLFTDDAGAMEFASFPVKLVENPSFNIKITYPEDLRRAEDYIKSK